MFIQTGIEGLAKDAKMKRVDKVVRTKLLSFMESKKLTRKEFAKLFRVCPATVTAWLNTDTMPETSKILMFDVLFGLKVPDVVELLKIETG